MMKTSSARRGKKTAFTLIELLVAMSITLLLMAMLVQLVSTARSAWRQGEGQAESFTSARTGVDLLSRELQAAVVNLDLGFRMDNVNNQSHRYTIKFLTRRAPTLTTTTGSSSPVPGDPNAVMKVCYQLGWADKTVYPKITAEYSAANPVPVLVRTTSTYLEDVFTVPDTNPDPGTWAKQYADITGGLDTSLQTLSDPKGVTEVLAENVLGWELHPIYWDATQAPPMVVASPGAADPKNYYGNYLTSSIAPRAIEIKIAVVATQPTLLLSHFTDWQNVFSEADLFTMLDPVSSTTTTTTAVTPYNTALKREIRYFDTTVYLQSKTP